MEKNRAKGLLQDFDYESFEEDFIRGVLSGKPLSGEEGVLTPLVKRLLEASLDGEIQSHLLETGKLESNRRNGKSSKTLKTEQGAIELLTPRDRNGTFDPQIVKKRQTILNKSLDSKVLSLYSTGMSYKDIKDSVRELYGLDVSEGKISLITDQILDSVEEWRTRPLDTVYPMIFMDAMFYKVREEGKVVTKCIYSLLGINQEGKKDILGFYLSESEGANFWLSVLTDLKNRGVKDFFIACMDGLKGFPKAISSVFPKTEIQLCIVHQIRNSLKHVSYKDKKAFATDLKKVYQANDKSQAEYELLKLDEKWGKKYPLVINSWNNKWENLSVYFKYPADIRKVIYTTNIIESVHRQFRKLTKTKGAFPNENSLLKLLYLGIKNASRKWTMPVWNWS
jgi:transposase-like protein